MKKIKLLGLLLLPYFAFSQSQPGKTFTEKLEGVSTSKKELTKNASTDNTSIGQAGAMTNSVPLVNVSSRTMSFPIQLQYASGIKVDQRSGPTGLGWVLPIGSITRDIGSYYPDYTSTSHESQMFNVVDNNLPADNNKGKFNSLRIEGNDTIHGTYLDPAVQHKYLGFDAISNGLNNMPLSDMYHISVPGKLSNSFFNSGGISQPHLWRLSEIENWKIAHTVKNYKISQEFSRINELNLQRYTNGDPYLETSYATAIGVLPYVENGLARIALTNTSFVPSEKDRYVRYDDFEKFVITDENGTKYVFGRALRGQRYVFSDDPYWSNSLGYETFTGDKGSFWKIDYIAEWLLTEIQSPDYKDLNGNKIADDGDAGDWIRFDYTEATKIEPSYLGGSCVWMDQEVPKYREWSSYSQTDKASSLMRELAYLQRIVTPTQEIDFTISERYDVEHDYYTKPANRVGNDYYYENRKLCTSSSTSDFDINYPVETMKYDSIKIKSRLVNPKLYPNENLQSGLIKFNYAAKGSAQELAVSKYLIRNNNKLEKVVNGSVVGSPSRTSAFSIEEYNNSADRRGKTTLLGVEFYGTNVSAPQKTEYKFEYGYNPSFDEFHKREIVRAFYFPSVRQSHSQYNQVIPFTRADGLIPSYKEDILSSSGLLDSSATRTNISPYDFLIDFPYKEANYKFVQSTPYSEIVDYADGYSTNEEFGLYADYNPHGVNPIKDIYGYCFTPVNSKASEAWSLTKITYPTGGEVSFKYEPASFTESSGWSIKPSALPIITRYNQAAKTNSYVQDAYNRRYTNDYNLTLSPKKLTSTFELDLPLKYGIRLKEKSSNDKINPIVKVTYEYENGLFTALPAEFIQNALSGFNQFVTRENHKHSIELGKYNLSFELSAIWDYDYAQKMSAMSHTNISLDDYSSVFFYKKIRSQGSDSSFIQKEYGSALTDSIEFPDYKLYCTRLQGGSSWLGSYAIGGNNLWISPISIKSEASFEANATIPYQKTTYAYERTGETPYYLKFDYNGSNPGAGKVILWDVYFNYYKPVSSSATPSVTKYDWVRTLAGDTVVNHSNNIIGVASTDYTTPINYIKWMSSKTYLKKETTDYKGIVSETTYRYEKNSGTENKYVLRDTKKQTIGESAVYITRNKYAFETYSASSSKFRDSNLISLPYQTITYLNDTLANKVLSSKVVRYDITLSVPKILDSYQYETTVDPLTGTFTLPAFSTSDPNWRISETDVYMYNPAAMPVSTRSNQLFTKAVTGNGLSTLKANISGTERPFDATYSGFEDFTDLKLIGEWNDQSYLKEDWFTTEVQKIDVTTKITFTDHVPPCTSNVTWTDLNGTFYYVITTDDITNLKAGDQVDFSYTVNGSTTIVPSIISGTFLTSDYPDILLINNSALDHLICFQTAPLPNIATIFTNSKVTYKKAMPRLSNSYARTGKYSYKLASIRTSGEASKKTPVRLVRIAPLSIASECNIPEEPGEGEAGRNPNIPVGCYWDYQASLWIKYDTDTPPLTPTGVPSTPYSDDATADAIYRRGDVSASTVTGVQIRCKVWNSDKTILREEFIFYPQDLNSAWKQYTIDFSVFKGPEQWVEVYVENTINQVGTAIMNYKAAFVDDIVIAPKEARYNYNVTNALGQQTFQTNNNDVFVESIYDPKGRNSSTRNAYGKILQELTYFDQPNWTTSENYVTEVKWVANGLFNTTRYFMDGFGRTAQVQSSDHVRNLRMISETNIYNDKGQVVRSYKPYYLNQYGLVTKHDASYAAQTQTLYGSNYAYTDVTFESKPESVVSTVSVPRTNGESAIVSSQTEYMNPTAKNHTSTAGTNTFPAGTLLVNEVVNPVGKITRSYLNRLGQVVMEEHQIGMDHIQNTDGSISFTATDLGFAQTWFYYDGAGRLVSTYDPENKKTSYIYNSLGVLIKSISSDKGISELRYDRYGQVRFTRNQKDIDATTTNSYGTSQFKYVKYDKWGQTVESGVVTVAPNSLGVSTTSPPFPTGDFFNDYTKINDQNYPLAMTKFVQVHVKSNYTGTRKFYTSTTATEQITYSQHVLSPSTYLYTPAKTDMITLSYMADGQAAKTSYTYDGLAGTHQILAVYNELNLPIGKDYVNSVNSITNFKWRTKIDIYGRAVINYNTYNSIDNETSKNYYDPLGNLLLVGLGTTGNTSDPHRDYLSIKKNIREQLVSQMSKNYRVGLTYDAAGNITNQYWSNEYFEPATVSATKINQYAYTYDKMNRLIGADYKQSTIANNPFAYYGTLNATIPNDFICTLDDGPITSALQPYFDEFSTNIANAIDVDRSNNAIAALNQLKAMYINNNKQYSEMSTAEIDAFFTNYLASCNANRLTPTDFEYYEAEKASDATHIAYLTNNRPSHRSFKYMRVILGTMPWTAPVNCMPNPTATAYGYLSNFPAPAATQNSNYFDEAFWYQKNGNFYTLNRNNNTGQRTQQLYGYQSGTNKLTQASFQFTTGTPTVINYTYDANGNLLTDPKNSISGIGYSFFDDLPVSMTNSSGQHNYRYFGGARSVKEISATDREYYIDQVILDQNGTVKSYQTAGGYATPNPNGAAVSYFYQVKDWLGSPHITMSSNGTVQNAIDYYSYGKAMPTRNSFATSYEGYRYQFTGHEKDGETSYQYHGARYYDEDLGRYMSVDRFAMKFFHQSPYVYAGNMPINAIDHNGDSIARFSWDGKYLGVMDDGKEGWIGQRENAIKTTDSKTGKVTYSHEKFAFSDPVNDPKDLQSGVIDHLIFVRESDIKSMMKDAGAFNPENQGSYDGRFYAKREGQGGHKLDFSYTVIPSFYNDNGISSSPNEIPSSVLFYSKGTAYNHSNFGNYLFGAAGEALGVPIGDLMIGAHYNSKYGSSNGYKSQWDSADDQWAIIFGYFHAKTRNYDKISIEGSGDSENTGR